MNNLTHHQEKQVEVIDQLEQQIKNKTLGFSTVVPVDDYLNLVFV